MTGFFASEPVHTALAIGGLVAVVSGVVGVFTVIRRQSFAGHSLGDISATGGSGAFLVGVNPLVGFVTLGLVAAGGMELLGVRRPRGRDVATGIVLGAALGLSSLLLYLDTTVHDTSGAAATVLFGSLFAVSSSLVVPVALLGGLTLAVTLVLWRPLLLSSVSPEMAIARGVGVRTVGVCFLVALAVAVALSALTVGAVLSTALLIGPAAAALRLTSRPGRAMVLAAALGIGAAWGGVVLAYASAGWPPSHRGWPVSFFVVTLTFLIYLAADLAGRLAGRAAGQTPAPAPGQTPGQVSEQTSTPASQQTFGPAEVGRVP